MSNQAKSSTSSDFSDVADIPRHGTVEWAHQTMRIMHAIWAGHSWKPTGWLGWHIHVGVDDCATTVTAYAVPAFERYRQPSVCLAQHVDPGELNQRIREAIAQIRKQADLPEDLRDLGRQPDFKLPAQLLAKLRHETRHPVRRNWGIAQSILLCQTSVG